MGDITTRSTFLHIAKKSHRLKAHMVRKHGWKALEIVPKLIFAPLGCSLCLKQMESLYHIFLHNPYASNGWIWLLGEFGLSYCLLNRNDNWLVECLTGSCFKNRANILWQCAVRAFVLLLWLYHRVVSPTFLAMWKPKFLLDLSLTLFTIPCNIFG